jgi:hypothetical protein
MMHLKDGRFYFPHWPLRQDREQGRSMGQALLNCREYVVGATQHLLLHPLLKLSNNSCWPRLS